MSVIEFKLRNQEGLVPFICQQVQEAFNRATQLLEQAKAAPPMLQAATGSGDDAGVAVADDAIFLARARMMGTIKFDAQVVETNARLAAGAVLGRRKEFADEAAFLGRCRHALDAEFMALEVQILCAEALADEEVRRGLERPEAELQYLRGKEKAAQRKAEALDAQIGGSTEHLEEQPL